MRKFRIPLVVIFVLLVCLDLQEAIRIYTFGWPPQDVVPPAVGGGLPVDYPARDVVTYGVTLIGIGLIEVVVMIATWKAWR